MSLSIYGKIPSGERLKRIQSSANFKNNAFQNLSHTPAMAEDASFFKTMREFLNKPKNVKPPVKLPSVKGEIKKAHAGSSELRWFGHSSYLLQHAGRSILVDPVFSGNAAPVSCMVRAFKGADVYSAADMPTIDVLLLTHDHYDHLDYKTVLLLKSKVKHVVCSLGVGSHLEHWGYDSKKITELDWWEEATVDGLHFTATPARHFSGRGIKRGQTLWSSFAMQAEGMRFFLGGDSGYDKHFGEIGKKFGGFDLAILECGQYNKVWPHIHMMPEQTALAATDLGARLLLPVHWAKFSLAMHAWDESIERVTKKAREIRQEYCTPMIGEKLVLEKHIPQSEWWKL